MTVTSQAVRVLNHRFSHWRAEQSKFHMHSLTGFNRIPVDVGVHQLQAQALRSAFLRLEDKLPALPLVAGSFADPILYGKYGDNFSLYFHI